MKARAHPARERGAFEQPQALAIIAQLAQALGHTRNRALDRLAARDSVGPHLDAPRAGIVRQIDPLFADLDLLAARFGVGRLELARRAETQQAHLALLKSSP